MPLWDQPAPELSLPSSPTARPNAAGMGRAELRALLASIGEAAFRADQVFEGLYKHRYGAWEDFTNLSKALRAQLAGAAALAWPEIVQSLPSRDHSTKHAFRLADGKEVEGVHMPYANRTTLCLSSQVGCAMGCTFCATGAMGIKRNLQAGEIVGQVLRLLSELGPERPSQLNLVFMGMGEPLHNLANVHQAIRVMCDRRGLDLAAGRITVSTSGLVSGIEKLSKMSPRPLLALSLNATTDEMRSTTMPVNRAWNLARLRQALDAWGPRPNEKFTFEFVLLAGVNDTDADADRLAAWLGELRHRHVVNLIPMNEHAHAPFHEPLEDRIQAFSDRLKGHGCFVTVRRSRGRDVQAACGQLVKEA
jgi:23S rRNA (adenine2503-C2)-methyltransferase